jgi:predicted dehydrogenase
MTRAYRTVVVGFGAVADTLGDDPKMAQYFAHASHAQALADHPAFAWDAVVDPDPGARQRAASRWGIGHLAPSAKELPNDCRPEIAIITTPPGDRLAIIDALPSLRAVMVEKPLSLELADASEFATQCSRRGLVVQVNFWRRGNEDLQTLAGSGLWESIGDPQSAFGLYGNGLFNNGSHLVDLVRMLMGEVASVQATGPVMPQGPLVGDVALAFSLALQNGGTVALHPLDFSHYREVGLDIWGTSGRLTAFQESLDVEIFPLADHRGLLGEREIATDRPETFGGKHSFGLRRLYDNLIAALEGSAPLLSPLEEAMTNQHVLHAVLHSAAGGGKRVAVERRPAAMR